jgi:cytochrome P450
VSFGAGQRNCIGQYLARIEYKIALATFLRKFSFETDEEFVMHVPSIYESQNNKFTLHKLEK